MILEMVPVLEQRELLSSGTRGSLAIILCFDAVVFTGTQVNFHKICMRFVSSCRPDVTIRLKTADRCRRGRKVCVWWEGLRVCDEMLMFSLNKARAALNDKKTIQDVGCDICRSHFLSAPGRRRRRHRSGGSERPRDSLDAIFSASNLISQPVESAHTPLILGWTVREQIYICETPLQSRYCISTFFVPLG